MPIINNPMVIEDTILLGVRTVTNSTGQNQQEVYDLNSGRVVMGVTAIQISMDHTGRPEMQLKVLTDNYIAVGTPRAPAVPPVPPANERTRVVDLDGQGSV